MTTYAAHLRISAIGEFRNSDGSRVEQFSYGLSMGNPGPAADSDPGGMLAITQIPEDVAAFAAAFRAFHATANLHIAPSCVLTMVKVAAIGLDGTYLGPPAEEVSDTHGGGTSQTYPSQVALAVTQDGPVATHRQHGRFYIPGIGTGLGDNWLMPSSQQTQVLTATRTLVTALNAAEAANPTRVVIASQKGSGHNWEVQQLRCGDAYDTQRRRRNELAENYAVLAV